MFDITEPEKQDEGISPPDGLMSKKFEGGLAGSDPGGERDNAEEQARQSPTAAAGVRFDAAGGFCIVVISLPSVTG